MLYTKQTICNAVSGNCFPACISSLLEIPLETIPNFCTLDERLGLDDGEWFNSFVWWCDQIGFSYIEICCPYNKIADGQLAILIGKSPRYNCDHAVVGRFSSGKWDIIHDPSPGNAGLAGDPKVFGIFIPVDPAYAFK